MTTGRRPHVALLLAATFACPTVALAQNGIGRVEFERTGYRLTALGAKVAVSARLVDARRRAVPNAPIAYRTSDPNIAVVSNQGVVQSKRVGRTKVWAVSGTDSASALIVVDQWATTFAFSPPAVLFDAIGTRTALNVQLRDAAGNTIPDQARRGTTQCRARDDRIATLLPTGHVVSKTNGITWVRCTDRGISDSVRVEVRQRPARVMIADKLAIGTKEVPDTFRLRARTFDPKGDSISGARATWVSLERGVVSIDPLSGIARAVGPGTTRIVAQVGDATDTVAVTVTGAPTVGVGTDTSAANAIRQPTLVLDALYPVVGDTVKVTFTAKDAAGAAIPNPERDIAILSSNDTIIRYIGNLRVVPRTTGTAYIIARLSVAGVIIAESISVSPRAKAAAGATASGPTAQRPFVRPVFNTDSMVQFNQKQIRDQLKSIVDSGIGRPTSGRLLGAEVVAAHAEHATRLSSTVAESRSGLVIGGTATLAPFRRVIATGGFRTGTLSAPSGALGEDLALTEADAQLAIWPASWFGIGGGYMLRGERTEIANAAWSAVSASLMSRGRFVGGAVSTYAAVTLFPVATFSGRQDTPEKTSMAGEAGLDLRLSVVTAGLTYYVEKFTFAAQGATGQRIDEFSMLRLKLGLKFGR